MATIPHRRWTDSVGIDMRGLLALLVIIGLFVLAILHTVVHGAPDVPPWAIALASLVTGHYFGTRAIDQGVAVERTGGPAGNGGT